MTKQKECIGCGTDYKKGYGSYCSEDCCDKYEKEDWDNE